MELTYKLQADSITETLLETIKSQFRGKEISIIVKDVEAVPESSDQVIPFEEWRISEQSLNLLGLIRRLISLRWRTR